MVLFAASPAFPEASRFSCHQKTCPSSNGSVSKRQNHCDEPLVSGSPDKLTALGRQYGVRQEALLGYEELERLREMEDVKVVHIVLPNSMHKEYVLRSAA